MKTLNQMKSAAGHGDAPDAARMVLEYVHSMENEGEDDTFIRATLGELAEWALSFRDSIGAL